MLRDVKYHLSFFEKSFESLFDHSHLFISRKDVMTEIFHLVSQSNKDIVFNCKLLQNQLNLFNVSAMFGPKRIHLDLADMFFPGNGCWEMPRWGNLSLSRVLIGWACKVSSWSPLHFLSEYSACKVFSWSVLHSSVDIILPISWNRWDKKKDSLLV